MATTISWAGGDGVNAILPAESGVNDTLGFFGAAFGFSIQVGQFNNTCYVTTDNGSANHGQVPNLKYLNATGCYVASELVGTELREVDNGEATLRIRLNTDTNVATQNTSLRVFDRTSINNNPSGVAVYAAEIIKPQPTVRGVGDSSWTQIYGSGSTLSLADQSTPSGVHTWYIAMTASPTTIGSKLFAIYMETEFV